MTLSAFFLGIVGILLTFLPEEILQYFDAVPSKDFQLILQLMGALYLGFAMLNWFVRGNIIGGIYNRPVAMANFTHFVVAGFALIKSTNTSFHPSFLIFTGIYLVFALFFGIVLFRHPLVEKKA
jgi:hypothetical protein